MNTFNPLAMLNSRPALATSDAQNASWNWSSLNDSDNDDNQISTGGFSSSHHESTATISQRDSNRSTSISNTISRSSSLDISGSSLPKRPSPAMTGRRQRKMSSIDAFKRNLALMDTSSSSSKACFTPKNKQLAQEETDMSNKDELPVIMVRGSRPSSSSRLKTVPVSSSISTQVEGRSGYRRKSGSRSRKSSSTPKTHLELHIPNLAEMAGTMQ